MLDVAIVGGGPAGLCMGHALQRAVPGLQLQVFERVNSYRPAGAGVGMAQCGLRAVQAINPALCKEWQDMTLTIPEVLEFDSTGKHLNTRQLPPVAKAEGGGLAGWYEIQSLIYKYLGTEHVSFSHHFQGCSQEEDGLTISFHEQPPVRARLLIGADGYFSAVRSHCLNDGPPSFAGKMSWRSRAPWKEGLPEWGTGAWQYFGGNRIGFIYPIPGGQTVVALAADATIAAERGVHYEPAVVLKNKDVAASVQSSAGHGSGAEALERAKRVFADYAPEVQHILELMDPSTVLERGMYERGPEFFQDGSVWGHGSVTLIGDAAHPLCPTGMGMSMAMESCAELAWHIQQGGINAESLRAYERSRLPRVRTFVENETARYKSAFQESGADGRLHVPKLSKEDYAAFQNSKEFHSL